MLRVEMTFHTEARPIVQLLLQCISSGLGLKAERIAGEVDDRPAVGCCGKGNSSRKARKGSFKSR
jgi:hypothetical protein